MNDGFMVELYDGLHDTPTQQKFCKIAPMPVGVVFIQAPDMTEEEKVRVVIFADLQRKVC